jgi:hypothetical protein
MRLANNMMFANMEAFKTSMQLASENIQELSRIGVNTAKTFEQTSRGITSSRQSGGTTANTARNKIRRRCCWNRQINKIIKKLNELKNPTS